MSHRIREFSQYRTMETSIETPRGRNNPRGFLKAWKSQQPFAWSDEAPRPFRIPPSATARQLKDKRYSLFSPASAFVHLVAAATRVPLSRRKGPARAPASPVLCRANNSERCSAAARCFNSVSKHTPTLLCRGGTGRERPRAVSLSLSHGYD